MKKIAALLLVVLLLLSLAACVDSNGDSPEERTQKTYDSEGRLESEVYTVHSQKIWEKSYVYLENDTTEYTYIHYNSDAVIWERHFCYAGEVEEDVCPESGWEKWYENGRLSSEASYYEGGIRVQTVYDSDGNISSRYKKRYESMNSEEIETFLVEYYENGIRVYYKEVLDENTIIEESYRADGTIFSREKNEGNRHTVEQFDENGDVTERTVSEDEVQTEVWTKGVYGSGQEKYYPDGYERFAYVDGVLRVNERWYTPEIPAYYAEFDENGDYVLTIDYQEDGTMYIKVGYYSDSSQRYYMYRYEDGTVMEAFYYANGATQCDRQYDENGKLQWERWQDEAENTVYEYTRRDGADDQIVGEKPDWDLPYLGEE